MDLAVIFLLGLVAGSFLNVCIHRLPRGQSLAHPGSRCPTCGRAVAPWENIPVLSYVALAGRCRGCRAPISLRYPLVELLSGGAFCLAYARFGATPGFVRWSFFLLAMLALVWTDWDLKLLPDEITLGGLIVGLGFAWAAPRGGPGLGAAVGGAALGAGLLWVVGEGYFRLRGRAGMGLGDVKMMALVGAFLGWRLTLTTIVLASLAGSLAGLGMAAVVWARRAARWRRKGRSRRAAWARAREGVGVFFSRHALPFGVFLGTMAVASWLWGEGLWVWYLRLAFGAG